MPRAAARHLVESSLRNGAIARFHDVERLRDLTLAELRRFPLTDQKLMSAAVILAQIRGGAPERAREFAELVKERGLNRPFATARTTSTRITQSTPITPSTAFLALEGALAESYLASGDVAEAMIHTHRMLSSVPPGTAPQWHLHALGLGAAAHAFAGDHVEARRLLEAATRLRTRERWPRDEVEFFEALAGLMLASTALNGAHLLRLRGAARELAARNPQAQAVLGIAEVLGSAAQGDYWSALSRARALTRTHAEAPHRALTEATSAALTALLFVQRGSPAQGLSTLRGWESPRNHLICFESIAATAHLQMGNYRAALQATDACVRVPHAQHRWLLPVALMRRAVAKLGLGYEVPAARTGLDALGCFEDTDPALSLAFLPLRDVLALFALLERAEPRAAPRVRELRRVLRRLPPCVPPAARLPALSPGETKIALRIRGRRSYSQIAAGLYVSPSTVKTQAHAIARKLGVRTRAEVVRSLELAGFYALHSGEEWSA